MHYITFLKPVGFRDLIISQINLTDALRTHLFDGNNPFTKPFFTETWGFLTAELSIDFRFKLTLFIHL